MRQVEDCILPNTKGSDSLDQERHSKMLRRSSSPISLTDLDMWDTKSRFKAQTSAWCGMATGSGTGFLSKVSTSTRGSTGGFRQNDPGVRRWQSLSHLVPEDATQPFPSSLGAKLLDTQGECSFRKSEVVQWLQNAHERLDAQLNRLRTRDAQLSYHITTAQLSDMKHKQLSGAMSTLEQEKEATKISQFENSQQCSKVHEKVQILEKDLLQMRSTLDRGSNNHSCDTTPGSLGRSLPKVDTKLYKLREAETRAETQEVEQNQVLQQLQSSTERTFLNQINELNHRLSETVQNNTEVQQQLTEANNKISQACLEKAILSTQVLKLEDNIKDLKARLMEALSEKDDQLQHETTDQILGLLLERTQPGSEGAELHDSAVSQNNKQDKQTVVMEEESKALKEVNEKLSCELETIRPKLEMLQCQLEELRAERITDLKVDSIQLIREKEEMLNKMNGAEREMKEQCSQLRESVEVLQLENQKLQDQCLCLEAKLLEKQENLHLQDEEYRKQDAMRVQTIEELKAVSSHWTEKWQKVALTLQSTQEELDNFKKDNTRDELQVAAGHLATENEKLKKIGQTDKEQIDNLLQQNASMEKMLTKNKKESDSLLRLELDACKQELELERGRSQMLLHRCKNKGGEAVQTRDRGTVTDLSEISLLWVPPPDSHSSQHKSHQAFMQNSEAPWLKIKLAEREKELQEKAEALKTLESLRETEKTEAQIKISALELKLMKNASEDDQDGAGQANVSTIESLRTQLEESRRRVNQLQQEKMLAVQRLQTLKQLYPIKDEKTSVKGRKDVNLETEQQRRMVTEQLKNLFKEREEKEVQKVDNTSAAVAAQTRHKPQDWTPAPKVVRTVVDRWNWQRSSGLMPVFEEDEEDSELLREEEGAPEGEVSAQESIHNQTHQMSAMSAEHNNLKAKHENVLQALRFKQPLQDLHTIANIEEPHLCDCSNGRALQQKPHCLYPDGIFLAERVDISSPDEEEEEGEDKGSVS